MARGWVSVTEALPDPAPGYRASLGLQIRDAAGTIGFGHYRPAGQGVGVFADESWDYASILALVVLAPVVIPALHLSGGRRIRMIL